MHDRDRRRGRRTRRRLLVALSLAGCVLLTAGVVTAYATRSANPSYRLATVGQRDVSQTLRATGTIEPESSATVSFPIGGTVATVLVSASDTVQSGQPLATLDATALQAAVASAQAAVATAKLTVQQALASQASAALSSAASAQSSSSAGADRTNDWAAAQQAILRLQTQVDDALRMAQAALSDAEAACAEPPTATTPTTTPTTTSSTTPSTTPTSTTTIDPAPTTTEAPSPRKSDAPGTPTATADPTAAACAQALHEVLDRQTAIAGLQQSLAAQEAALDKALDTALDTALDAALNHAPSHDPAGRGDSAAAQVASAAQLAADQAAVDAAEAALTVAEQDLQQATIVSPITGTVSAVGLVPGQQVAADSSSATIGVIGGHTNVVTIAVDVTRIADVTIGQPAIVQPDGGGEALPATVVAVGVIPASGTSYQVRVGLTGQPTGLRNGTYAAVSLVTGHAAAALTVPTSAVHRQGRQTTVQVLSNGAAQTVPVTVGAVGSDYTEITSGLSAGQQVILADLGQPIPSGKVRFGGPRGGLGGGVLTGGGPPK